MELNMDETVEQFFDGKSVFITGGTGFMGKVLIEKLLRSCSGIEKLYVLVRPSRTGKTPAEKIRDMYTLPLFDRLKREKTEEIFKKVYIVEGDVKKISLGISPEDRKLITENVSVIFHVAASVRFDDPLNDAIIINTRGTREMALLARETKNLTALLHVSTTYSNCNRKLVEEVVYPAPMNWREAIYIAEKLDSTELNILSKVYLGSFPNTYVFTKNLGEQLLADEFRDLPIVIFRPSIVISSVKEPMPGWIDNFNGPVGFFLGIGKGIIRATLTTKKTRPDYMPVDISIKGMIVSAWAKGTGKYKNSEITVINSSSGHRSITMQELMDVGREFALKYPPVDCLWVPAYIYTPTKQCYYANVMIKQVVPAVFVDLALSVAKKPPLHLLKIQRKIYRATIELAYFTANNWTFVNDNFLELLNMLSSEDREWFDFLLDEIEPRSYLENAVIGGHKYLLNTDITDLPNAAKRLKRMLLMNKIIKITFWLVVIWYLYKTFYL